MTRKVFKKIWKKASELGFAFWWLPRDFFSLIVKGQSLKELRFFLKIGDHSSGSHTFDKHYVYMDRWALKRIFENKTDSHVDIGSSVSFVAAASLFAQVKYVDLRPSSLGLPEVIFLKGDILHLPFADNSQKSLSCLHVAEHIGLGRYGDKIDARGTQKACAELKRVLSPGGRLYFALPVGKTRIFFNAHRIYSPEKILEYFHGLKLLNFAAVDDLGRFHSHANPELFINASYACGMFEFSKE